MIRCHSLLKRFLFAVTVLIILPASNTHGGDRAFNDGDIIFQTSRSSQSTAIRLATHSPYTHMGIIFRVNDTVSVLEAVQPVRFTPLRDWVRRGEKGRFVVKRLKNAGSVLTPEVVAKMKKIGEGFLGRDYDRFFEWSDDRLYCSELVWKIYNRALDIEIGKLQKLKEFDLSSPEVKKKLRERYGAAVPLDEPVISPSRIFDSELLETVAIK